VAGFSSRLYGKTLSDEPLNLRTAQSAARSAFDFLRRLFRFSPRSQRLEIFPGFSQESLLSPE
jgi:hypothetical protein